MILIYIRQKAAALILQVYVYRRINEGFLYSEFIENNQIYFVQSSVKILSLVQKVVIEYLLTIHFSLILWKAHLNKSGNEFLADTEKSFLYSLKKLFKGRGEN